MANRSITFIENQLLLVAFDPLASYVMCQDIYAKQYVMRYIMGA